MTTQQNKDTDKTLGNYPQKLLNAKSTALLVTIPHTKIEYDDLHNKIITKNGKNLQYIITKLETHEDGEYHIHLLVKSQKQFRISAIHNIIMSYNERTLTNGLINYQKPENINATIQYLKKEDTAVEDKPFMEWGEAPKERGRPRANQDEKDKQILEALELAKEGNQEEALASIRTTNPRDYLLYKNAINETLHSEKKPLKKWDLPTYDTNAVKLTTQQQKLWEQLQQRPKARQIFWITGDYGSGKTFIKNYIENNYEYGAYDAGQSASLDNVAYAYNEEGAIMWDLPRTFNFTDMGDAIGNVIEKFSDYGTKISSKKYNGKTQHVRGHTIVFSNSAPLDQLKHRNINHIHLVKENDNSDNMEEEASASFRSSKLDEQYNSDGEEYESPTYTQEYKPNKAINTADTSDSETETPSIKIYPTNTPNIDQIVLDGIRTKYKIILKQDGKQVIRTTDTYTEALKLVNLDIEKN